MIVSNLIKPAAVAATAFGILMLPGLLAAQAPTNVPSGRPDPSRVSPSGNYLAARHASQQRDAAAASAYYRAALKGDPRNSELLEGAFLSVISDGEMDEAIRLAERLVQLDRNHRLARLVLGVRALSLQPQPTLQHRRGWARTAIALGGTQIVLLTAVILLNLDRLAKVGEVLQALSDLR